MQEVGHDPLLEEGQRPVNLLGRQKVAGRTPGVTRQLEPFARPQLERTLTLGVPGPQLSPQQPADQMVIAEAGSLVIECHQEQIARVDAAQQRRRVPPAR